MATKPYRNSAFEGSAARNIEPQRIRETKEERRKRENLIRITEKQLRQARRKNIKFSTVVTSVASIAVVTSLVVFSIAGQVQINELTGQINDKSYELSQLESVEVQLQMQAANVFDEDVIKTYVESNLNMAAINEKQVEYINITNVDKGTVYGKNSGNIFQRLASFFGFN